MNNFSKYNNIFCDKIFILNDIDIKSFFML